MDNLSPKIAIAPTALVCIVIFVGCLIWTVALSFTGSRMFPEASFVGFDQYEALFRSRRWGTSFQNMLIFGGGYIVGCLSLGYLLAVFIDQRVRGESVLRAIYLYPFALSYIVTGFAWQWFLNPQLGIEKFVRDLGWESFQFQLLANRDLAIYAIVAAAIWHGSGLVMAILLAALRGIDEEIWKAVAIEGIPKWRAYIWIVLPMLGPAFATCSLLLAFGVIRNYDLVVAMTQGGPGSATEVPAKFVMDYLFARQNVGLASAAATLLILMVIVVAVPFRFAGYWSRRRAARGVKNV